MGWTKRTLPAKLGAHETDVWDLAAEGYALRVGFRAATDLRAPTWFWQIWGPRDAVPRGSGWCRTKRDAQSTANKMVGYERVRASKRAAA